jgi:hypothetical protein
MYRERIPEWLMINSSALGRPREWRRVTPRSVAMSVSPCQNASSRVTLVLRPAVIERPFAYCGLCHRVGTPASMTEFRLSERKMAQQRMRADVGNGIGGWAWPDTPHAILRAANVFRGGAALAGGEKGSITIQQLGPRSSEEAAAKRFSTKTRKSARDCEFWVAFVPPPDRFYTAKTHNGHPPSVSSRGTGLMASAAS